MLDVGVAAELFTPQAPFIALFDASALSSATEGPRFVEGVLDALEGARACLCPLDSGIHAFIARHQGTANLWWGLDASGEAVELDIDLGVLLREVWAEEEQVSLAMLRELGEVSLAGSALRVVPPEEVPGPWSDSHWHEFAQKMPPELAARRPELTRQPNIELALWIEQPDRRVALLDASGRRVHGRCSRIELDQEQRIEWWTGIESAVALRARHFTGERTPMDAAPV